MSLFKDWLLSLRLPAVDALLAALVEEKVEWEVEWELEDVCGKALGWTMDSEGRWPLMRSPLTLLPALCTLLLLGLMLS